MKLSDIIQDVRDRTQQSDTGFITDTTITNYVNRALDDVSEVAQYERGPSPMSTVAAQQAYTLPADCLTDGLRRIVYKYPDGTLYPLTYLSRDEFDNMNTLPNPVSQNSPIFYTMWGNQFYLMPTPTSNGNNDLTLYYYGTLPYVSTADTSQSPVIPANRHEMLVLYACARVMQFTGDPNRFADYMQEYQAMKMLFRAEVERNNRDGPRQVRDVWYEW